MIALVWRYEVREQHRALFETAFGPQGECARLFARSHGFRGAELFRCEDGSYLKLDVWDGQGDFETFLAEHRDAYEALDHRTGAWRRAEHRLGQYEVLG